MMEWLLKTGSCGGLDYMVPDFTEVSIATEKRRKTMHSMLDNEMEKVLSSFENQLFCDKDHEMKKTVFDRNKLYNLRRTM